MNTLEFLQRVLPTQGKYAAAVFTKQSDKPFHKFFESIDDLSEYITDANAAGNNVYFAVNSFTEPKRKQESALYSKALYLDIDCGADKPFLNQHDALQWLTEYINKMGMPMPMLVSSGNGLHVYWLFDENVPIDEWQELADALKASIPMLDEDTFPVDPKVPADSARVLRPVGCTNRGKHGDEKLIAKVLIPNKQVQHETTSLQKMREVLTSFINVPKITKVKKRKSKLAELGTYDDLPPADAATVYEKCKQIKWCVDNQDKVHEPVWYNLMGVAAYCEDADEVAKAWSEKHPNYTEAETLGKMQQWRERTTGPATCAAFDSERPKGCDKCPFAGKITSPIQLGVKRKEAGPAQDAPSSAAQDVQLPKRYKRTDQGIVIDVDGVENIVTEFDIYPHSEGYDGDRECHVYRYVWKHPRLGWKYLVLPTEAFVTLSAFSLQKFLTECNRQGLAIGFKGTGEKMQMFMRGYMEELKRLKAPLDSASNMGWMNDSLTKFVIGDTVYIREDDGTVTEHKAPLTASIPRNIINAYQPSGTEEAWVKGTEALQKYKLPAIQLGIGIALASPLMKVAGIPGGVINLYGKSGAGKTLSQHVNLSVYGNPQELYTTARSTVNAVYAQLALRGNLPFTLDEATILSPQAIGDLAYGVTEGREKPRLNQDASLRNVRHFSAIVQLSANKPMSASVISMGDEADGQLYRLLDVHVEPNPIFTKSPDVGAAIHKWFRKNYGWVGRHFIKRLLEIGKDGLAIMYEDHKEQFKTKYGFQFEGPERYWQAELVAIDMALTIAKDLGLIKFSEREVVEYILPQIEGLRGNIVEQVDMSTPMSIISRYLNEISDSTATVLHTHGRGPMSTVPQRGLRGLLARIDLYRNKPTDTPSAGTLTLDKKAFKEWLALNGSDIRTVETHVQDRKLDRTPPSGRITIDKDISEINVGQVRVLSIDLDCPELEGIMDDTKGVTLAPPSKFTVVQGGQV